MLEHALAPRYPGDTEYMVYGDAGYDNTAEILTASHIRDGGYPPGTHAQANSLRVSIENVFGCAKSTSGVAAESVLSLGHY